MIDDEHVRLLFTQSIEIKIALVDNLSERIAQAGKRLVDCLLADGRIFICGNGGSMANCLHFSTAMYHCFEVERPSLPVINLASDIATLTGIANDGQFEQVFSRKMQALGQSNDMLIVLTATGCGGSLSQVVQTAQSKGIKIIALTGHGNEDLAKNLGDDDIELSVAEGTAARIREIHLFILHCFCDLIDRALFGVLV